MSVGGGLGSGVVRHTTSPGSPWPRPFPLTSLEYLPLFKDLDVNPSSPSLGPPFIGRPFIGPRTETRGNAVRGVKGVRPSPYSCL